MSPTRMTTAVRAVEGAIVFTDIAGFTEFTAVRGDEAALELLSVQEQLVRDTLREQGRVVKELGDGLMLWFEDACNAVECSLALQERFDNHSTGDGDLPLWVRIGIHFGRPSTRGQDLVGHDVNLAARIVDLAAPGEVLISQAVCDEVGDKLPDVVFEEVGPMLMKGIPEPVALYRALRF